MELKGITKGARVYREKIIYRRIKTVKTTEEKRIDFYGSSVFRFEK